MKESNPVPERVSTNFTYGCVAIVFFVLLLVLAASIVVVIATLCISSWGNVFLKEAGLQPVKWVLWMPIACLILALLASFVGRIGSKK